MLVSHRFKFIYTKTEKTASTSVESYFERFCMPDGSWEQSHGRNELVSPSGIVGFRGPEVPANTMWWNHMSAQRIKQQLGDGVWNSYFKFCVVRDPFEKCISAFEHFGKEFKSKPRPFWQRLNTVGLDSEQRRFLDFVLTSLPSDHDKYIIDGNFCLDDVIRYEDLEREIERICRRLGVPFESEFLPSFKRQHRRAEATVQNLYSKQAVQEVAKKFAFELSQFGYELPTLGRGRN